MYLVTQPRKERMCNTNTNTATNNDHNKLIIDFTVSHGKTRD